MITAELLLASLLPQMTKPKDSMFQLQAGDASCVLGGESMGCERLN